MLATHHYDVIVIGSGPIGLALVNLLGCYGVRCAIVERNLTTVQEPRAVSIDDESLRTLQNIGIVNEVLEHVVAGYGSIYYGPDRRPFVKVEPTGRPYGYPRRNAFRQPILEQQLRDGLLRFSQVDRLYGWTMETFEETSDGVVVHLEDIDGSTKIIKSAYIVGCDGAWSKVREKLGFQLQGTTFEERWLIVDLENNTNTIKHTEVYCDPSRPCITLPGPDGTRRFEFKLLNGESDADLLAPEMVDHLLRSHGADPGATLRRKVVYRFHARAASSWSRGRAFLAGDAAHLTPPFAGQGMNSGLRDAQNLAWKLAAVTRGVLGPGVLATYERERSRHLWEMIRLALRMGKIMSPRSRLHGLATRSAFRALAIWPKARDYVAEMKYKPKPFFTEGFILADDGAGLVGRLIPQPEIITIDGQRCLLDDVLGDGFSLVLRDANALAGLVALDQPVWSKLGVRRIALLPAGAPPPDSRLVAGSGITVILEPGDTERREAELPSGVALLLRPDRYVAARVVLTHADAIARQVEALVASTWAASALSSTVDDVQVEGVPAPAASMSVS